MAPVLHPAQSVNALFTDPEVIEQTKVTPIADDGALEVQTVLCPAFSAAAQADYFIYENAAGDDVAVWLDLDANGTEPTGAAYVAATTKVEVDIVTGDTAAQVATKVKTAMDASGAADVTVSINSATLTLTQDLLGPVTAPARHSADDLANGSFTVATTTQGAASSLQNTYFTMEKHDGSNFHVWFNVNGEGVDPAPASSTECEVAISAGATASAIATAMASAVDALASFVAESDGSSVYITNIQAADLADSADVDSGVTVETTQEGRNSGVKPATSVTSLSNNPSTVSYPL